MAEFDRLEPWRCEDIKEIVAFTRGLPSFENFEKQPKTSDRTSHFVSKDPSGCLYNFFLG